MRDERGLAAFHKTGCLVMKTRVNGHLKSVCTQQDALGIPWEDNPSAPAALSSQAGVEAGGRRRLNVADDLSRGVGRFTSWELELRVA